MTINTIDLHNTKLYNAQMEICESLIEAHCLGHDGLSMIHGYRNGQAIRNYIRNPKRLLKDVRKMYPEMPEIELDILSKAKTRARFVKET